MCLGVYSSTSAQQQNKADTLKPKQRLEDQIKQYWFVMLMTGKNRTHDSATAAKIQEGHMANINRLYYEGKLKVAGPFGDNGNWRGIFIFDCNTKEEVENLLNTDPAIASGRLAYEVHPWWTASMGSFAPGKPHKD
ncbi:MAG: hypothetical protein JWP81_2967 [Ferruginibacter sp.]|nr:hypothetical protein [Ferruginibacter sp.]